MSLTPPRVSSFDQPVEGDSFQNPKVLSIRTPIRPPPQRHFSVNSSITGPPIIVQSSIELVPKCRKLPLRSRIPPWESEKTKERIEKYIQTYSFMTYAQSYFRPLKTGTLILKRYASATEIINSVSEPIQSSLHNGFDKIQDKESRTNFKSILGFLEIGKKGFNNARITDMVKFGKKNENFCCELFAQVMKESNTPSRDVTLKGVQLLTVLVSVLVPPPIISNIILSFFARIATYSKDIEIIMAAQFGLIRLEGIILSEKPLFRIEDFNEIQYRNLLSSYQHSTMVYNISLLEVFWNQEFFDEYPVPTFLLQISHSIFALKCHEKFNVFRSQVSDYEVEQFRKSVNRGDFKFKQASFKCIAMSLISWIKSIPGGLFSLEYLQNLISLDNFQLFLQQMDQCSKNVLGYLIGFTKQFFQYSDSNRITQDFFLNLFAPIFTHFPANFDDERKSLILQKAKDLINRLYNEWDVSFVYLEENDFTPFVSHPQPNSSVEVSGNNIHTHKKNLKDTVQKHQNELLTKMNN